MFQRLVLCWVVLLTLFLSQAAGAFTVTLNPGIGFSEISSGVQFQIRRLIQVDFPTSGTWASTSSTESSTTTFNLSTTAFSYELDHSRETGFAQTLLAANFSIDSDVEYEIAGAYTVFDSSGRRAKLRVQLVDVGAVMLLYDSQQESRMTPNESFVVGGAGGDFFNALGGSEAGTLSAGLEYRLLVEAIIWNTPEPFGAPATASGTVTISFVPEPSTGLSLSALAALVALKSRRDRHGS